MFVHQQQRRGGNQPDGCRFHPQQCSVYIGIIFEYHKEATDKRHDHDGRQTDGRCGDQRAGNAASRRRITDVGGAVDDNRAGRHLRDGNDVGKFTHRKPSVCLHHFILHHRQHGVPPTEAEQPDFKEPEK